MLLVAIPEMVDNQRRSDARDDCRARWAARANDTWSPGAAADATWMRRCGYYADDAAARPGDRLRQVAPPDVVSAWPRSLSIGACMEYHRDSAVTRKQMMPSPCFPGQARFFGEKCFGSDPEHFFVFTPSLSTPS